MPLRGWLRSSRVLLRPFRDWFMPLRGWPKPLWSRLRPPSSSFRALSTYVQIPPVFYRTLSPFWAEAMLTSKATINKPFSRARVLMTISCLWATGSLYPLFLFILLSIYPVFLASCLTSSLFFFLFILSPSLSPHSLCPSCLSIPSFFLSSL